MKEARPQHEDRITADPKVLGGKPVVRGTRIAVRLVLEELAHNPDVKELLAAHPDAQRMFQTATRNAPVPHQQKSGGIQRP